VSNRTSLLAIGGLVMAASSVVTGAGYVLTPPRGHPGIRFGAFGDPRIVPTIAVLGVAGGFALLTVTVWLVLRVRAGAPPSPAREVGVVVVSIFVVGAVIGLWISVRADPPLPPSWDWIRIPQAAGLAGAGSWFAGLGRIPSL
jgi:hypothetical protein